MFTTLKKSLASEASIEIAKFNPLADRYSVVITLPITDKGDFLMIAIDWNDVTQLITSRKIHGNQQDLANHLMLFDGTGRVIACFDRSEMFVTNLVSEGLVSAQRSINSEDICEGCPVLLAFQDGKSHSAVRRVNLPDGQPSTSCGNGTGFY